MVVQNRVSKLALIGALMLLVSLMLAPSALGAQKVTNASQISFAYVGTGADTRAVLNITVPDSVKLPAELEFNFPISAQLQWSGEIMGGDTSKDIQVMPTKISGDEQVNRYKVTLTNSHIFQVEGSDEPFTANKDGVVVTTIGYKPATDADALVLGVEVPPTATVQQQEGLSDLGTGNTGQVYGYSLPNAKADKAQAVEVGYKSKGASSQAGATKSNTLLITLVVALVLVVMALIVYAASQRARAQKPASAQKSKSSGKTGTSKKKK